MTEFERRMLEIEEEKLRLQRAQTAVVLTAAVVAVAQAQRKKPTLMQRIDRAVFGL